MRISSLIPKHLQDTFATPIGHVYQYITDDTSEDSTSSVSSDETESASSNEKVAAEPNIRQEPMPTSASPPQNKRLEQVLEGTFGSEIIISDEDGKQENWREWSAKSSLPKRKSDNLHRDSHGSETVHRKIQRSHEEDWLMGNASRKSPPDATKILDPMARFREWQTQFGLRPVNTMGTNASSTSLQSQFYQQKVRRPEKSKLRNSGFLSGQDGPPYKKPRIASPMDERSREVIDLEDSQDSGFARSRTTRRKSLEEGGNKKENSLQPPKPKMNHVMIDDYANHEPPAQKQVVGRYDDESPDDLSEADFAKTAAWEQQRKDSLSTRPNLDRFLFNSTPSTKEESHRFDQRNGATPRHKSFTDIRTPHTHSKLAARLAGQSPDELHSAPIVRQNSDSRVPQGNRVSSLLRIPIRTYVGIGLLDTNKYSLVVDKDKKGLFIDYEHHVLSDEPMSPFIPLSKITKIVWPDDEQCQIVILVMTGASIRTNQHYVEFATQKGLTDFRLYIVSQDLIKSATRGSEWLQSAMAHANARQDIAQVDALGSGQKIRHHKIEPIESEAPQLPKRPVLGERLNDPSRHNSIQTNNVRDELPKPSNMSKSDHDVQLPPRTVRVTRSLSNLISDEPDATPKEVKRPIQRRQGTSWQTELTYPPFGRKRETVSWEDIGRLEDDEFLNDNLVGIFLRYLQEHSDQERLKKMHFFSSFFFEKLMNGKETKGTRKQINYQGVANWTSKLNLFTRDFVIVPVNENLHWYVMIICNLSELKKATEADENDELSIVEQHLLKNEVDKTILASDVVDQDLSVHEQKSNSWQVDKKTDLSRKGRRKPFKPFARKYDVKKPIIITLDSLNIARSATATALKQYIVEEAREKLGITIEQSAIQGMTAKGTPLQSNYSDCGLYVCMYIEQFMRDPYGFVRRILQREEAGPKWPRSIESRDLRQRFYNMLQNLYKAQELKQEPKIPEIGSILVSMENENDDDDFQEIKIHQLSAAEVKSGAEFYHKYKASQQQQTQDDDVSSRATTRERFFAEVNRPIELPDEEDKRSYKLATGSKSPYFERGEHFTVTADEEHIIQGKPSGPDFDSRILQERISPSKRFEVGRRETSVSTDWLEGPESYARRSVQHSTADELEPVWEGFRTDDGQRQLDDVIEESEQGDDDMLMH